MKYLIKENNQLKEQIKDLKSLLELNRDALLCSIQEQKSKSPSKRFSDISKTNQETYSTFLSRDAHHDDPLQDFGSHSQLLVTLIKENRKLASLLDHVIEERNVAQNKSYLNERIIQQNIEFEEEIVSEYKEKIESLKMNIRTKEYILHEFECLRLVPTSQSEVDSNTYFIFKEVTTPQKVVASALSDKKNLENELVEERMANSKIRKDYKSLYDKAQVSSAIELRKVRSVLSNRLATKVSMNEIPLDQFKSNLKQLKFIRRGSLDSQITRIGKTMNFDRGSGNPLLTGSATSRLKTYQDSRQTGDKANYLESLVTSRGTAGRNLTTAQDESNPGVSEEMLRDNKILSKVFALTKAKNVKMREELKKAKFLLNNLNLKCKKLQEVNVQRTQTIENLQRQLSFYEGRYYNRLGCKVANLSMDKAPEIANFEEWKGNYMNSDPIDDGRHVDVSVLDHSGVMDVSRVHKNSLLKRKRNNKGSIHILNKESLFKKSTPGKMLSNLGSRQQFFDEPVSAKLRQTPSADNTIEMEAMDYREAFKLEEAKAYLRQLAKELLLDTNSRAKFTFARMKNKKFIDFGLLPTPVLKTDRSMSCPPLTTSIRKSQSPRHLEDATLILDRGTGFGGLDEDYSIDYDFDELKRMITKNV